VTEGALRLLASLRAEPVDCTPVWFMRQAGRALPEYRTIRERYGLLEICRRPELCAEVTLQPVTKLGVDAAIIFADIMTPLIGAGLDIEIVDGVGPVVARPIASETDLNRLGGFEPETHVPELLAAIRLVTAELGRGARVPALGFSGAPFTLASYLIEGRPSRDFLKTKRVMYCAPKLWHGLMQRLADMTIAYLRAQVRAGAAAVQLFDSWAGALSPADYRRFVQPYSARILSAIEADGTLIIHFSTGTAGFLDQIRDAGGTTIGVDWRIPIDVAWSRVGYDRGIQGNLDPLVLLGPAEEMRSQAHATLDAARGRPGHIFNLGHGVHPETPVDSLKRLVNIVHSYRREAPEVLGDRYGGS
jgi:uroporphyrinogen decarboxylase